MKGVYMESSVIIIGYGVVGRNLRKELSSLNPDIYDKYKPQVNTCDINAMHDVAFVCVDTPMTENGDCDISELESVLASNHAKLYVIKSTVLPGTSQYLAEKYKTAVVFSPEYYGGTQHCLNVDFDFTILGGDRRDCIRVQQLLQRVYDGKHRFAIVDAKTAELAKYMENAWIATKVSFCNQFFDVAEEEGVDYEILRELFLMDPRVNPSHTFVYRDHPYWSSHCLDKDVPAIANRYDMKMLKSVMEFNRRRKERFELQKSNIGRKE